MTFDYNLYDMSPSTTRYLNFSNNLFLKQGMMVEEKTLYTRTNSYRTIIKK